MKVRAINFCWLLLSAGIVLLDQQAKLLIIKSLGYEEFVVGKFLNLILAKNTGAAFSLLRGANGWQNYFFLIIALCFSLFIGWWIIFLPRNRKLLAGSLALILGGAVGNLCDRIVHGYVIDFLDFHIQNWHWPTFNLADAAITGGIVLLSLHFIFTKTNIS